MRGLHQLVLLLAALAVRNDSHWVGREVCQCRFDVRVEFARRQVLVDVPSAQLIGGRVGQGRIKDFTKPLAPLTLER